MSAFHPRMLEHLPALLATEATETGHIQLPVRFRSRWHRLVWYPAEADAKARVAFGLTLRIVPEWRFFAFSELEAAYRGEPVVRDPAHRSSPAGRVEEVRLHRLDDLSPFVPSRPSVL